MEKHEIELGIRVGNRHVRDIQEQALNDLAKDLKLKGRVLTYEDVDTLKSIQVAGDILKKRIERFYEHFDNDDTDATPVIDKKEEDEFI